MSAASVTATEPAQEEAHESSTEAELWRTVCISNLSDSLKEDQLRDLFKACGEIEILCIKLKFGQGRVCYIRFDSNDSAQTALLLNDKSLDSKPLQIQLVDDEIVANYKAPPASSPSAHISTNVEANNDPSDEQQTALQTVQQMSAKKTITNTLTNSAIIIGGTGAISAIGHKSDEITSKEEEERQEKLARTIYVGNLNPMIQSEHLSEFFGVCGTVNLVKIAGNSTNPQAARYGFVEFEVLESARSAYNLSGHFLLDRPIKIGPAKNAILNPHPSKANIQTNPVKINHAMAKVRLLQKRITNRYQDDDDEDQVDKSSIKSKSKSKSPPKAKKRSRSRSRSRSRHSHHKHTRRERGERSSNKRVRRHKKSEIDKTNSKRNERKDRKRSSRSHRGSRYIRNRSSRSRSRSPSYGRYSRKRSYSSRSRSRSRSKDRIRRNKRHKSKRNEEKKKRKEEDVKKREKEEKKEKKKDKKKKKEKKKEEATENGGENDTEPEKMDVDCVKTDCEENGEKKNGKIERSGMIWDGFQWHPAPNVNVSEYRASKFPPHLLHNKRVREDSNLASLAVNSPNIQQAAALAACGTKLNTKYPPNPMNACPLVNPEIAAACAAAAAAAGKLTPQQATILKLARVNKNSYLGAASHATNNSNNNHTNEEEQQSSIMAHQLSSNAVQQQMNKFFPSLIPK